MTAFWRGEELINLQNGGLVFPEFAMTLLPLFEHASFVSAFPKDKIKRIRNMGNGYVWYDICEKLYETDYKIPIRLCFNPETKLEFIHFYPQSFNTENNRTWSAWTKEEMQKDKQYCDSWLLQHCNLSQENNVFSWGTISSYYDPRSASCGIAITYIND